MKEELLVERAKQLLDKQSALDALERQLRAKQEALYWRERCLRSEHLTVVTTTGAMATAAMPPLIHIRPGVVGLERRRVTLAYQPDRHVLLQQTHTGNKQVTLPLLVCARTTISTTTTVLLLLLLLLLHPFSGLYPRTVWVSRHQKGKPFWILLEQEMMGWYWHQLDHMQIICSSLQTDNHANTSPLSFYRPDALPAAHPTLVLPFHGHYIKQPALAGTSS